MTARQKLSASLEDYIEAIYLLGGSETEVRPKEIVARMGVTGPSVTEALRLLSEKNLVHYVPYGAVTLTDAGKSVAQGVYHRHKTLKRFFVEILGIDEADAEKGACEMEHVASQDLVYRLVLFTSFVQKNLCENPQGGVERFKEFMEQRETNTYHHRQQDDNGTKF
nr:metal-dependent transcriptional regulator [uncultured Desulfobulbus sp.]